MGHLAYDTAVATLPEGAADIPFCVTPVLYAYPVGCFLWPADPVRPPRVAANFTARTLQSVGHLGEHVAQGHCEGAGNRKYDKHHHPGDHGVFHRAHRQPVAPQGYPPRGPRLPALSCAGISCRGAGQSW